MTDPLDLDALNAQQRSGKVHPYTCGVSSCRAVLVARADGWRCPACSYRQPFNPALIVISQTQNDLDALERLAKVAATDPHPEPHDLTHYPSADFARAAIKKAEGA